MTVKITKGANYPYCFITGLEKEDKLLSDLAVKALEQEMSYYVKNFERTDKYKRGEWDGREVLMGKSRTGSLYFPIGLLNIAVRVLKSHGIDVKIENLPPKTHNREFFEWKSEKKLYKYQEDAVLSFMEVDNPFACGGVICLPTGSGKTLILCEIIRRFARRTLVIVHTKELLHQWDSVIREVFGIEPAIIGDGSDDDFEVITIATMQTLNGLIKKGKRDLSYFKTLIVDEAHRAPAETIYSIALRCNADVRCGATATPRREDNADLKMYASLGPLVVNITPTELINKGYIAKPTFMFLRSPFNPIRGRDWHDVRAIGIVANGARNEMIVEEIKKLVAGGHKIYVSVDTLDHGDILEEMVGKEGIKVRWINGSHKSNYRSEVIREFKSGEVDVIISTLLKEGVDIPEITAYVNAGGGKSEISNIQRVGRALRQSKDGTKNAVIVDFVDGGHKFLSEHWDSRWRIYREFYGELCPFVR